MPFSPGIWLTTAVAAIAGLFFGGFGIGGLIVGALAGLGIGGLAQAFMPQSENPDDPEQGNFFTRLFTPAKAKENSPSAETAVDPNAPEQEQRRSIPSIVNSDEMSTTEKAGAISSTLYNDAVDALKGDQKDETVPPPPTGPQTDPGSPDRGSSTAADISFWGPTLYLGAKLAGGVYNIAAKTSNTVLNRGARLIKPGVPIDFNPIPEVQVKDMSGAGKFRTGLRRIFSLDYFIPKQGEGWQALAPERAVDAIAERSKSILDTCAKEGRVPTTKEMRFLDAAKHNPEALQKMGSEYIGRLNEQLEQVRQAAENANPTPAVETLTPQEAVTQRINGLLEGEGLNLGENANQIKADISKTINDLAEGADPTKKAIAERLKNGLDAPEGTPERRHAEDVVRRSARRYAETFEANGNGKNVPFLGDEMIRQDVRIRLSQSGVEGTALEHGMNTLEHFRTCEAGSQERAFYERIVNNDAATTQKMANELKAYDPANKTLGEGYLSERMMSPDGPPAQNTTPEPAKTTQAPENGTTPEPVETSKASPAVETVSPENTVVEGQPRTGASTEHAPLEPQRLAVEERAVVEQGKVRRPTPNMHMGKNYSAAANVTAMFIGVKLATDDEQTPLVRLSGTGIAGTGGLGLVQEYRATSYLKEVHRLRSTRFLAEMTPEATAALRAETQAALNTAKSSRAWARGIGKAGVVVAVPIEGYFTVQSGMEAVQAYKEGRYEDAIWSGVDTGVGAASTAGTVMLLTPAAPAGVVILIGTTSYHTVKSGVQLYHETSGLIDDLNNLSASTANLRRPKIVGNYDAYDANVMPARTHHYYHLPVTIGHLKDRGIIDKTKEGWDRPENLRASLQLALAKGNYDDQFKHDIKAALAEIDHQYSEEEPWDGYATRYNEFARFKVKHPEEAGVLLEAADKLDAYSDPMNLNKYMLERIGVLADKLNSYETEEERKKYLKELDGIRTTVGGGVAEVFYPKNEYIEYVANTRRMITPSVEALEADENFMRSKTKIDEVFQTYLDRFGLPEGTPETVHKDDRDLQVALSYMQNYHNLQEALKNAEEACKASPHDTVAEANFLNVKYALQQAMIGDYDNKVPGMAEVLIGEGSSGYLYHELTRINEEGNKRAEAIAEREKLIRPEFFTQYKETIESYEQIVDRHFNAIKEAQTEEDRLKASFEYYDEYNKYLQFRSRRVEDAIKQQDYVDNPLEVKVLRIESPYATLKRTTDYEPLPPEPVNPLGILMQHSGAYSSIRDVGNPFLGVPQFQPAFQPWADQALFNNPELDMQRYVTVSIKGNEDITKRFIRDLERHDIKVQGEPTFNGDYGHVVVEKGALEAYLRTSEHATQNFSGLRGDQSYALTLPSGKTVTLQGTNMVTYMGTRTEVPVIKDGKVVSFKLPWAEPQALTGPELQGTGTQSEWQLEDQPNVRFLPLNTGTRKGDEPVSLDMQVLTQILSRQPGMNSSGTGAVEEGPPTPLTAEQMLLLHAQMQNPRPYDDQSYSTRLQGTELNNGLFGLNPQTLPSSYGTQRNGYYDPYGQYRYQDNDPYSQQWNTPRVSTSRFGSRTQDQTEYRMPTKVELEAQQMQADLREMQTQMLVDQALRQEGVLKGGMPQWGGIQLQANPEGLWEVVDPASKPATPATPGQEATVKPLSEVSSQELIQHLFTRNNTVSTPETKDETASDPEIVAPQLLNLMMPQTPSAPQKK